MDEPRSRQGPNCVDDREFRGGTKVRPTLLDSFTDLRNGARFRQHHPNKRPRPGDPGSLAGRRNNQDIPTEPTKSTPVHSLDYCWRTDAPTLPLRSVAVKRRLLRRWA